MAAARIKVYLEVAPKRTFAAAVDWPGWTRSGRDEASALEALLDYAPRYARAIGRRGSFVRPGDAAAFEVVERLKGGATTEFGAPGEVPQVDEPHMDAAELKRQQGLLETAWRAFDEAARAAKGVKLRTGPRGGGRPLPKIIEHVFDAESSYLRKLGAKFQPEGAGDVRGQMPEQRALILAALTARARGEPIPSVAATRKLWPPRYFVRRAAWHVLDHAWEIEDRAKQ